MNAREENVVEEIRHVTYGGMVVNFVIAGMKLVGGLIWNSQALIADAVHSISDLITDVAVVIGVKYWEAPADEEHPYGHGKIQAMVTLFIGVMLAFVAYELAKDAISTFFSGGEGRPGKLAFFVAVISVVLKEWLFRWTRAVAKRVKSPALEANAWHHRSDALSSIPVAIAVALSYFFPKLWYLDAVGALIVALFIVRVVWEIIHPALQELTDAQIDDKSNDVVRIAMGIQGVREVHQCRARRYGGAFHADLHIKVDRTLSIVEAHSLSHIVKNAIISAEIDITDVIIHIEPADEE